MELVCLIATLIYGIVLGAMVDFPYYWRVKSRLPERKGQPCRVLIRSKRMNSCLVEFVDGYKVVTSRNYLRKQPQQGELWSER